MSKADAVVEISDIEDLRTLRESKNETVAELLSGFSEQVIVSEEGGFYAKEKDLPKARQVARECVRAGLFKPGMTSLYAVLSTTFDSHIEQRSREIKAQRAKEASQQKGRKNGPSLKVIDQEAEDEAEASETIRRAIDMGASDIHLDVRRKNTSLYFRVDGLLKKVSEGWSFEQGSRLVRMYHTSQRFGASAMDERGVSDAQFEIVHDGETYAVRLSTVGTINNGMKFVARIRNPSEVRDLDESGYTEQQSMIIRRAGRKNEGMALVVGPTNSGKSTTLTSLMAAQPRTKCVFELADPVEAELPNVVHVEMASLGEKERSEARVRRKIDATTRQDTDLLVIGEIRDGDSAKAAERMAEQGKLVFSTLHTASVTQVMKRLGTLGVSKELFFTPNFLRMVVAQKLIATLCPHCSLPDPSPKTRKGLTRLDRLMMDADVRRIRLLATMLCYLRGGTFETGIGLVPDLPNVRFVNPDGCSQCNDGFKGRTLVAEAMEVTEESCEIFEKEGVVKLRRYLLNDVGMTSMREHALSKICLGALDPLYVENRVEEIGVGDISKIPDEDRDAFSAAIEKVSQIQDPDRKGQEANG